MIGPLKRAIVVLSGPLGALASCVVLALGALHGNVPRVLMAIVFLALAIVAVMRRLYFTPPPVRAQRASRWLRAWPMLIEIELAMALLVVVYAAISLSGGLSSPLYPLLFVLLAFSASFQPLLVVGMVLAVVVMLEMSLVVHTAASVAPLIYHCLFAGLFLALHWLFLRGLVRKEKRHYQGRLAAELATSRAEVRDFRLIASALGDTHGRPRPEQRELLLRGGASAVRERARATLEMTRFALSADTAALVWLQQGSQVSLKAVATQSATPLVTTAVPCGVLAQVLKNPQPSRWKSVRGGTIPYYDGKAGTTSLAVCPVEDDGRVRGLICVDRAEPFKDWETGMLLQAAKQVSQSLESEKLFLQVERAKYEHEKFFHASAKLCQALTVEQVMETALDAAQQIAEFEVGALTLYDADRKRHRVCCLRDTAGGDVIETKNLLDLEFRNNSGLVSMVVKNRHFLPAGGEVRENLAPIFTKRFRCKRARSLLVLPLLSGEHAIGAMVLASRKKRVFPPDVRTMLGVIANQVAVSLENGLMFSKMEMMATTDGLTNLTNHRTFQDRFGSLLDSAGRHGREVSILLCDVDHFKKVNDTYGHPVGDEVLRRVAAVLRDVTRKIDIPARYGGEEFAVVLDATTREGAVKLADRIRIDISKLVIPSEQGPFSVTMSIGVATFPVDGRERAELIEHADQALYHAKESGRNRVVHYSSLPRTRKLSA